MADILQSFPLSFHRFRIWLVHRSLYVLDVRAILGTIGIIRQEARCLGVLCAREEISTERLEGLIKVPLARISALRGRKKRRPWNVELAFSQCI